MKKIAVGLLFLAGSGCTLAPKTFVMPDGQTGYLVECNGSALTIASCYNQAAKFCGGKYEVVGQDGSTGMVGVNGMIAPLMKRSLQFTCAKT